MAFVANPQHFSLPNLAGNWYMEIGGNQTSWQFQSHSSLKFCALFCSVNAVSNVLSAANSVTLVHNWI
jgi:hypothetical protein